jgi:DNA repair protein RadD
MTDTLRGYQVDVIAEIERAIAGGERRILLVAPTGSGKTVIGGEFIGRFSQSYRSVLVLAHRLEIVTQTSAKLHARDIRHGIIKAGFSPRPMERVQVASVQTLWVRAVRSDAMQLPPADLLIVDECHHATAMTWRKLIAAYPDAVLIGLTATPCRGDGRGLGGIFTTMIECPQVAELIAQGYLVKTRVYAPVDPDLRGVKTQAGDYVESQLADRMDVPKLMATSSRTGTSSASAARPSRSPSTSRTAGTCTKSSCAPACAVSTSTAKHRRTSATPSWRLASGETEVVTNCMVLTEGWDMPEVGCAILARPTKKMGLYRQMIGRVLRPADGKADAIILDHSGAVYRHGLAEDPVEWTLDPEKRAESKEHQARANHEAASLIECSQCSALRLAGQACPHCGFLPKRPPRDVPTAPGELGLFANGRARSAPNDPETRQRWHAMFAHIARERGFKSGWIAHKYREKFGTWPAWGASVEPITPTPEVRSWVRSRQIAFAKSRGAA